MTQPPNTTWNTSEYIKLPRRQKSSIKGIDKIKMEELREKGYGSWWTLEDPEDINSQLVIYKIPNVVNCFCDEHPLCAFPPFDFTHPDGTQCDILLAGIPRSGNTVVWQILKSLGEDNIARAHDFESVCPIIYKFKKIICTIRHPFDVAYSLKRLDDNLIKSGKPPTWYSPERIQQIWDDVLKFVALKNFKDITNYRPNLDITFIKYEDYWHDPTQRIINIANFMEKDLKEDQIISILEKTSVDSNFKRSQYENKEKKGRKSNKMWQIQPKHVGPGKGVPGQGKNLDNKTKQEVLSVCKRAFSLFNYAEE